MGNIFNLVGRIDIDNSNAQKSMADTQKQAQKTAKTVSKSFGGGFTNSIANGFLLKGNLEKLPPCLVIFLMTISFLKTYKMILKIYS